MKIIKTGKEVFEIHVEDISILTDWEKRAMEGCCSSEEYSYYTTNNRKDRNKIYARLKSEISIVKEVKMKKDKLNIDLNDLTPEAKAELSKYIRAYAREEIKRVVNRVEKSLDFYYHYYRSNDYTAITFTVLKGIVKDVFKEICDAET